MFLSDKDFQRILDDATDRFPAGPYAVTISAEALRHAFKEIERQTDEFHTESDPFLPTL